jgi:hypothetical protein
MKEGFVLALRMLIDAIRLRFILDAYTEAFWSA